MKRKKLGERMREAVLRADLPTEAFFDMPKIALNGDTSAIVERHHGVIEYSDDCIKLAAKGMTVVIRGGNLQLVAMNSLDISVRGTIMAVELIRGDGA